MSFPAVGQPARDLRTGTGRSRGWRKPRVAGLRPDMPAVLPTLAAPHGKP